MWYSEYLQVILAQTQKPVKKSSSVITGGYEEDILRKDAENSVKRRLHYQGEYNPNQELVESYIDEIMADIKQKYVTYNNVRWESKDGKLTFAVEASLNKIIPLRQNDEEEE